MNSFSVLLFPATESALLVVAAIWLSLRGTRLNLTRRAQALRSAITVIAGNFAGSLAFGAFIAHRVHGQQPADPLWFLPLLLAPIEYWARFGLPILLVAGLVYVLVVRSTSSAKP